MLLVRMLLNYFEMGDHDVVDLVAGVHVFVNFFVVSENSIRSNLLCSW